MSSSSQPINQPPYQLDSCFFYDLVRLLKNSSYYHIQEWDTLIMKLLHFQAREYSPPQRTSCRGPALWAWPSSSGPCVGCSPPVVSSTFLLFGRVPFCIFYTFRKYNRKCSFFCFVNFRYSKFSNCSQQISIIQFYWNGDVPIGVKKKMQKYLSNNPIKK